MANGSQNFLQDYNATLPAAAQYSQYGTPVAIDCFGNFFNCFQADASFQMSFDGSSFFDWNLGLAFQVQTQFTRLWFRNTSTVPVNIAYYAGNVSVINNQLNIINEASAVLSVSNKIPPTYLNPQSAVIPAAVAGVAGQLVVPGVNNGKQRKDIYIFNLDANYVLSVSNAVGVIGGVVYPLDNLAMETSDTIVILNQNPNPVNVMVMEIYYLH